MTGSRPLIVSLAALALALAAAGCGSSGDSSSTGSGGAGTGASNSGGAYGSGGGSGTATAAPAASPASTLKISAQETNGLSFDKKTLAAKAGKVTISMDNPGADSQPHAVAITGPNGVSKSGRVVQPGGTSTVSVTLKPGKYTFYCPVPGHRQAGMEGTLTVQ